MIKENQGFLNVLNKVLDALSLIVSLLLTYFVRFYTIFPSEAGHIELYSYMKGLIILVPFYLLVYYYSGLYTPQRRKSFFHEFFNIATANIVGFFVYVTLLYLTRQIMLSRMLLLIFPVINVVILSFERAGLRMVLRFFRKKGFNKKHVLIIGSDDLAKRFAIKLEANAFLAYNVIGFADDCRRKKIYADKRIVSTISDLESFLDKEYVDEIFIAIPLKDYEKLGKIVEICEKTGVKAQIIPDYNKYLPAKSSVDHLDGIPLINIRYIPLEDPVNGAMKRIFDIVFSLFSLILISPILLISAIIIKLESKGPVIYAQERIGLDKKPFMMYKLRSMRVQTEEEEKLGWTKRDDPRKTRFGSFILFSI